MHTSIQQKTENGATSFVCLDTNIKRMKKSTIWIIAAVMGLSFLGLLYVQFGYIEEMAKMKQE